MSIICACSLVLPLKLFLSKVHNKSIISLFFTLSNSEVSLKLIHSRFPTSSAIVKRKYCFSEPKYVLLRTIEFSIKIVGFSKSIPYGFKASKELKN